MIKKLVFATALLGLSSVAALAADFSGKWTADIPGRQGNTTTTTFTFKVDGAALTGTISTQAGDVELKNGKVDGDNISFDVVREFNGNSMTTAYKGTADGADGIKFTATRSAPPAGAAGGGGGGGGPRPPQEFTAKRAK